MFESDNLRVCQLDNGLIELCFDSQHSVNILDLPTLMQFEQALDAMLAAEFPISGLMLSTAKPNFIMGADIKEFLGLFQLPETELSNWLLKANAIFCKLEDLPFPTACAISGFCLGGGMELALATDFRVVDQTATLGLPEIKLGIMPGFGGTVRLPRVIGLDNALEWITSAQLVKAKAAFAVGAADSLTSSEHLHSATLGLLADAATNKLDWQARRQAKLEPLKLAKPEALMSYSTAKALVYAKAGPHYPAPMMAVSTIEAATGMHREQALQQERTDFLKLAKSDPAQALTGLFLADQYIKAKAKHYAKQAQSMPQVAVLGAGIMGGGIAYQAACCPHVTQVIMKDIQQQALDLGLTQASQLLTQQQQRGKITLQQMASTLNHIVPSLSYTSLEGAKVVVEAVVEHPIIKAKVLAEAEQAVSADTIITSNTSTISINQLASALQDPSRFCGMHFFNPVHRMPLVEIIRGENTSEQTIASVVHWATQMGKSAIVVNDCPGFFVNRVLFPYLQGFSLLVDDGASFLEIDRVMEQQFGWPMGPAYLLDVVGIDTAHHARQVMAQGFPDRMATEGNDAIEQLYRAEQYGQKSGSGFYQYAIDKRGKLQKSPHQPSIERLIAAEPLACSSEAIVARMMIPMIIETVRCLEEAIVTTPAEADMALIYGLGFPPFRGGVFRYLETYGLSQFIQLADHYQQLGPLYQVSQAMRTMADKGLSYLTTPQN